MWNNINVTESGCWEWTGHKPTYDGYIEIKRGGHRLRLHRVFYNLYRGPVPRDMVIDHLCRVRHCQNPAHMEIVTIRENVLRGTVGEWQRAKTHCPAGHEYNEENTRWVNERKRKPYRKCRTCQRANNG